MAKASADRASAKVLYLSYDGMCDQLGASQVLPYLFGLARRGHRISLISFEKRERSENERAAIKQACEAAGIDWHALTYHEQPPVVSTLYDIRRMSALAFRLHREKRFDLVHCRSYPPALVGLRMKRRLGTRFLFDMRGFWADERREGGGWNPGHPLYRAIYAFFKRREREFWDEADQMVSLTEEGRRTIITADPDAAPIEVIPCCVDFDLFPPVTPKAREDARRALDIPAGVSVLAYLGSLGGNYMLDEMLDFFSTYRERYASARFLFITHTRESEIRGAAAHKGIAAAELVVRAASRADVPKLMAAANAGIAFKQPSFSAKACSPTKLGEMLALEIPVVTNTGVGDVDRIVAETKGAVVIDRFDQAAYRHAVERLDRLAPSDQRWRTAARRWFDLDSGIARYDAIYRRLANAVLDATPSNSD